MPEMWSEMGIQKRAEQMIDFDLILDALYRPSSRQIGKTKLTAEFAKKVSGVLVTFNVQSARQIAKEYDVTAISIQGMRSIKSEQRPIIFDQDAFVVVLREAIKLKDYLKHCCDQNEKLRAENMVLKEHQDWL